ncbi:MAG: hypothetical protein R6X33_04595 [Candidatus Brocadiia bacterium]
MDARAAELAAPKEAVRHSRSTTVRPESYRREGLLAYDRWVEKFSQPRAKCGAGDSYCRSVYRSTHRAAGELLKETAPKYPRSGEDLAKAASEFAAEADALDKCSAGIGWRSPERDDARDARLWPLLAEARNHYAAGIGHLEKALAMLG